MSYTAVALVFLFFAGIGTGLLFFGGLWLTLKLVLAPKGSHLWLFASFIIRAGIVFSIFFFLMQGDWQRLVALTTGFFLVRLLLVWAVKLNLNNYTKAGSV